MRFEEIILHGLIGATKEIIVQEMKSHELHNDRTGLFTLRSRLEGNKRGKPFGYGCSFPDETVTIYFPENTLAENERIAQYDSLKQVKNSFYMSELDWSGWHATQ